ncbi:MAG: PA domain-containing protein, partial [Schleiferiaceae bacterium]
MDDSTAGINTLVGTDPNTGNAYPGIPLKYEGCNLDTNSAWQTGRLAGKIVLIARGTCEFGLKVYLAEKAGARAVIMFNRDNAGLNAAPGVYGGLATIPFAMIARADGDNLLNAILAGQTVVAFLGNGTGGTYSGTSNVAPIPSTDIPGSFPYYVSQTNSFGCTSVNDTIMVTVNALPTIDAGADVTVCAGTPVTLSASGAATYSWNNGITNGVAFIPTATTTYTVTGTNANGCVSVDSVVVTVNPLPVVDAGADVTVCAGTPVTLSASGGASTYTWNNGITNGVAFIPTATTT